MKCTNEYLKSLMFSSVSDEQFREFLSDIRTRLDNYSELDETTRCLVYIAQLIYSQPRTTCVNETIDLCLQVINLTKNLNILSNLY